MGKVARFLAATTLAFASLFFTQPAHASCVSPQESTQLALSEATSEAVVRTIETCGGDDVSYQIPLSVGVTFDGQTFDRVYATTNSVITFGAPDGTYWDYPQTASISLYSMDWLIIPSRNADEHLVIQSSEGGFLVDISARPYWLYNTLEPTKIIITAAINYDGSVAISYTLAGPTYDEQTRTGVRLTTGEVVTLEDYGIVETEEAVVLTPQPVPSPTPEPAPEPSPEPTQSPLPEPTVLPQPPVVEPAPYIPPVVPEPEPTVEPTPEPTSEPAPPAPEPAPEPVPAPEPIPVPEPTVEPVPIPIPPVSPPIPHGETVEQQLAVLAEEARADDPVVPEELAAIPLIGNAAVAVLETFNALGNVGADMQPEVREEAQKAVVSAVIVGQIATTASLTVSGSTYRRIK